MAGEGDAAFLQVLVQNLIDLSKNEISQIRGLKKEAQKLTLNLHTIQQFLNDAETQTIPWLQKVENAAFEADNVLDELHYHSLSTKLKKKEKVLITCFSPFIDYARKRKMAVSIKEININLDSINVSATKLGLREKLADAPTVPDAGMETDSFSADPIFIGRDEDVSEIVETLITSVVTDHYERVFSILPIVGMGGSGKTTVTRRVFHHERIQTHFGTRIWVHVSQVFDPINLFKKIFKELTPSQSHQGEISRPEILKKLQEALKDKTYLLVLDDVWNEDLSLWKDFLDSLSGVTSTKGNGIILTTRNKKVASIVRQLYIHPLKGLSVEDCWSIIIAKAFGNEGIPSGFDESVGREIAESCGGLPLAASVVGGVLRRRKSADEWRSIRQNWFSSKSEGEINIKNILVLSFYNLSSPSLKKCFAYCSIFPKGKEMAKDKLIEMWMAEGFLGSEDMESVGEKFYNVLLHSSLLQEANAKVKILGFKPCKVERCVMHDLAHDLASSVLGSVNKADGVSQVRYLIQQGQIKKEVAQHLRTLIFRADQLIIFSHFNCLHVLTLKRGTFQELPISIRKLIHLRSLSISLTVIKHLPDWIGELHHLQTLRAPYMIEKLPSTIKYLINLRHLHIPNAELPSEIGRLTSLQTLSTPFIVRDENGYKIEELGSLNLKGSLTIGCLEKVHDKEEAEKANLFKKSKLSELWLWWSITYCREEVERNDENVLEGLQPHSDLKKLQIEGFDCKRFPEWTLKMAVRNEPQGDWVGLNQLVEIKLYGCKECEEIPMLGHLPNLKSLYLRHLNNVKSINSSFYGIGKETSSVFPVLETLELICMPSLKEWAEVESGSTSEVKIFPCLQSLRISYCNQLIKAPIHAFSSCLKSLRISYCNQLTTGTYFPLLNKLSLLTDLVLEGLNGLHSLPDKLFYNNPNLIVLKISKCSKLGEIPDGLQTLNSLKSLIIQECPNLEKIRCSSGGSLTSLGELEISECHELMDFPYEMVESSAPVVGRLVLEGLSIRELTIVGVPKFMASSVEGWHFPKLQKLEIDVSMEGWRETVDRILQGCSHLLEELSLTGMRIWEYMPESIKDLTSLSRLEFTNFGMEELPMWFDRYISNITSSSPSFSLKLSTCKRLRRLPSTSAMRRLIEANNVVIEGCLE